ncbi:uncharacterized protein FMAN_03918 [Fusarium mangiferae]|uniref:PA14 domain-containing protein n=1 Tax=Fusarium mangiferae TaxID=192010 RepID=A0A1L7UDQ4_FUSMA|nr:uncharacterized protein FMAN_03918 [Fusarium mangiferae]CVL06095.1 uncharacterized protein FMAN_03918 [Fusarium mangiferae]
MYPKKLLSLALSLFVVESVVAGPCKPRTSSATSEASTTLAESTTTILPVPSTTDTSVAIIETSTTAGTSEAETETATTLLTSTTAASVSTTTTEEETTTADETATTAGETATGAETTVTTEAESTTGETATTRAETTTAAESGTTATTEAVTTTEETTTAEAQTTTTAEAETTTTEAATTTAADPGCAQTILLANPTPIFDAQNGRYDDAYDSVTAPFPIEFFGAASSNVYVSTNGFLSLDEGASAYSNNELPAGNIPSTSIMPYWDDLLITEGTCNTGIFYDVYETARGNTFTIEYNVGSLRPDLMGTGEHFSVSFYEDHPGLIRFEYYQTTKHGSSATIGLQSEQLFSQVSYDQENSISDQYFIEIETTEEGGSVIRRGSL